jgi:hypothetical protein
MAIIYANSLDSRIRGNDGICVVFMKKAPTANNFDGILSRSKSYPGEKIEEFCQTKDLVG